MLPFFWYILKVMLCSGILFGYYWFFLRNKIFHQYNRFYLLTAISLSLLLPLVKISFWQPAADTSQAIRVLQAVSVGDEYMNNIILTAKKSSWTAAQLYLIVYILVSLILFFAMLRTLLLIRTLLKKYPVQEVEQVAFINTQDDSTPFSFFRYIFWNSSIDLETTTGRQIFKHEVAHVQEKHTYDKLFVNIILIFCWCNPFFWIYRKELNMIHEFIADKKAVEDSDTSAFAAMILQAAYPKHHFELANNFFYSPIKRRLLMLTKNLSAVQAGKNPKVNYFGRIMVLPLMALVFAAFSLKSKSDIKLSSVTGIATTNDGATGIEIPVNPPSISVTDTVPARVVTGVNPDTTDPLYIVNGKETDKAIALSVPTSDIEDMRIIKDLATLKIYGDKGKYGVVIINTKPGTTSKDYWTGGSLTIHGTDISKALGKNPLLIVDNIKYPGKTLNEVVEATGVKRFENIDVYAPEEGMNIYGAKAKDGVIIAHTAKQKTVLTEQSAESDLAKADSNNLSALKLKLQRQQELSAKAIYEERVVAGMKLNDQEIINQKLALEKLSRDKAKLVEEKVVMDQRMSEQELQERKWQQEKMKTEQLAVLYKAEAEQKKHAPIEVEGKLINPVFTKVEQNPQFTGGTDAWKKYLMTNLKPATPADEGWKAGKYVIMVKFIVHADGTVSDVTTENYIGSKTAQHCIEVIRNAPKWQPAVQNGRKVNAYKKQPITFVIEK